MPLFRAATAKPSLHRRSPPANFGIVGHFCRSYTINVMSKDSPRTIKDYYARVTLQRHHIGNPSESDERIEVVVRIPEEVAKTLAGGGKPEVVIFDVGSRVRNVATETAGVPNDSSLVIAVVSTVDAVMPPSLLTESNFKDQDGAEGWIL